MRCSSHTACSDLSTPTAVFAERYFRLFSLEYHPETDIAINNAGFLHHQCQKSNSKHLLKKVKSDTELQEKLKAAADAEAALEIAKDAVFSISVDDLTKAQEEVTNEELEGSAGGGIPRRGYWVGSHWFCVPFNPQISLQHLAPSPAFSGLFIQCRYRC